MVKKSELERFCGNCHYHSTYSYPSVIFCFNRFREGKNGILSILDCCEQWELQSQECFCLRDARERADPKKEVTG